VKIANMQLYHSISHEQYKLAPELLQNVNIKSQSIKERHFQ